MEPRHRIQCCVATPREHWRWLAVVSIGRNGPVATCGKLSAYGPQTRPMTWAYDHTSGRGLRLSWNGGPHAIALQISHNRCQSRCNFEPAFNGGQQRRAAE
jgi:hypothetical protein